MPIAASSPFQEAVEALDVRSLLPTSLSSAELTEELGAEFRERAIFSARVTKVEILQDLAERVRALAAGTTDHATQRLGIKDLLQSINYQPNPEDRGTIKDLSTDARIDLMLSIPTQQAQGYGSWMQGQNHAVLDEWPAQELYRAEARKKRRDWPKRWEAAGGTLYGGRMIALKDSPVPSEVSHFGVPYGPPDFGSGMDWRDVDRDAAENLGVLTPDRRVEPQSRGFNDDLRFDPDVRSSTLRRALEEIGLRFDPEGTLHLGNYHANQPRHPRGSARGGKWTIDPNSARQRKLQARAQKAADAVARENSEKLSFRHTQAEFYAWKTAEVDGLYESSTQATRLGDPALATRLFDRVTEINALTHANITSSPLYDRFRDQTLAAREAAADEAHLAASGRAVADHLPRRRPVPLYATGTDRAADAIARAVDSRMTVSGVGSNRMVFKIGHDQISLTVGHGNLNGIYAMDAGKSGKQLYAAADAWAQRNGRVNVASHLTRINQIRRTTNMLNSALDMGTTAHLKPEHSQSLSLASKFPPGSRQQDRINTAAFALAEKRNVMSGHPELRAMRWNAQSRKVVDRLGHEVSDRDLQAVLKRNDPTFRHYGVGVDTAKRAIQTQTVLRRRHPHNP